MSTWTVGGVVLPGDLEWVDEFAPARRQAEAVSLSGGMIVQRSRQTSGLPMTLQTPEGVYVTRQQVMDLSAMLDDDAVDTFTVTHPDGREFICRFRHGSGLPVDWANTMFRAPPQAEDAWHTLTLRMMTA